MPLQTIIDHGYISSLFVDRTSCGQVYLIFTESAGIEAFSFLRCTNYSSIPSFNFVILIYFNFSCFVLFCFVLFCFVLFCFVLFCFVLFCFVLFCFVLFDLTVQTSEFSHLALDAQALFKSRNIACFECLTGEHGSGKSYYIESRMKAKRAKEVLLSVNEDFSIRILAPTSRLLLLSCPLSSIFLFSFDLFRTYPTRDRGAA